MKYDISKFNPCEEAILFYEGYDNSKEAWQNCPRGDWMLWIAQRVGVDLRTLTRAKALCALTVRHLMKDERSIRACEVALKFADGKATRGELDAVADAAAAHAAAAYAVADAAAAHAAADAAYAAYAAAAYAAADAAYAAYAAAHADAAAAYAVARGNNQQQTADICREHLTDAVFEKLGLVKN